MKNQTKQHDRCRKYFTNKKVFSKKLCNMDYWTGILVEFLEEQKKKINNMMIKNIITILK